MRLIGADADYIAGGLSYFTAETHIRHIDEVKASGADCTIDTQVLLGQGKKMHLFHTMCHGDGRVLATGESTCCCMSDLDSRSTCDPAPAVKTMLEEIAALHADLPAPEGAGRAVGQKR